jgi:hypothetical protein
MVLSLIEIGNQIAKTVKEFVKRRRRMTVARITGSGLAAIALAVVALWGCFLAEQVTVRRARRENARILMDMKMLRRRLVLQPVSVPTPRPKSVRPAAG